MNKYNIKATFFVVGQYAAIHPELITLEVSEGFIVANHTYSHNISYLYSDPKNLVEDFKKNEILLKSMNKNNLIVLMHDSSGRQNTLEALPKVIEYLKAEGYIFEI